MLRQATRLVVRVLYRLDVRHPERFPAHGPVIVVANHESVLDPFVLGCAIERPLRFGEPILVEPGAVTFAAARTLTERLRSAVDDLPERATT